jgi:hypothetical protein
MNGANWRAKVQNENITKAAQTADLLCGDLTEAIKSAPPILGLLLMERLEEAAKLRSKLEMLAHAAEDADDAE